MPGIAPGTRPEEANPKLLLVGGDDQDNEQEKLDTPAVAAGLIDPGLRSPKNFPIFPSIPPVDVGPTLPNVVARSGGRGVWDSPPTVRGRALEQLFGHNLHPNYPTVDTWESDSGVVTSLKSIDLDLPTYRVKEDAPSALYSKLSKYVNDLAEFQGTSYAGTRIPEEEIKSRILTVIVPHEGTAEQQELMRWIAQVGTQRGLTVNFKIYP